MKTDDLIVVQSTNVLPARRREFAGAVLIAIGIGTASALCYGCAMFGTRLDGLGGSRPGLQIGNLALTLTLMAAGLRLMFVAARPGRRAPGAPLLIGIALLAAVCATVVGLVTEPPAAWRDVLFGGPLADCVICIPVVALPTLAALIWALRRGAPVNPTLSGAAAGLVAGALAIAAFALQQPADSLVSAAVLYGFAFLGCVVTGAILGWRLLRW